VAATQAERADLRKKVADFDLKLASLKDAPAQLADLKKKLNDARVKSAGFEADVQKKDLRLKELQLLVKTLGERLNDLADRPR
jgi:chromosome segregation ATPase